MNMFSLILDTEENKYNELEKRSRKIYYKTRDSRKDEKAAQVQADDSVCKITCFASMWTCILLIIAHC